MLLFHPQQRGQTKRDLYPQIEFDFDKKHLH